MLETNEGACGPIVTVEGQCTTMYSRRHGTKNEHCEKGYW